MAVQIYRSELATKFMNKNKRHRRRKKAWNSYVRILSLLSIFFNENCPCVNPINLLHKFTKQNFLVLCNVLEGPRAENDDQHSFLTLAFLTFQQHSCLTSSKFQDFLGLWFKKKKFSSTWSSFISAHHWQESWTWS